MFQIRTEQHNASRWYKADTLEDAMSLYQNLTAVAPISVEVWLGMTQLYKHTNEGVSA